MNAIVSGLPLEGISVLEEAMNSVYGEGVVQVDVVQENLRQKVHIGCKDGAFDTITVVLDVASYEICKSLETVQNSDKVIIFHDLQSFIDEINAKYDLSIVRETQNLEVSSEYTDTEAIEKIESLKALVEDKDLIITNLTSQIQELQGIIESNPSNSENVGEELKEELRASQEEHNSEKLSWEKERESFESVRKEMLSKQSELEESKNSVIRDLNSVTAELSDYKVKYSTAMGSLKSKEHEVETLSMRVETLQGELNIMKENSQSSIASKEMLVGVQSELAEAKISIVSKEEEILRLKEEINSVGTERSKIEESLKQEVEKITSERDSLKSEVLEKVSQIEELTQQASTVGVLESTKSKLEEKVTDLSTKLSESENLVMELNKSKIDLESELSVLQKSTNRDTDVESVLQELNSYRTKYSELSNSIYSRVSETALPMCSISSISVINPSNRYENIEFIFAGSSGSRKGMYKCLLNKISSEDKDKQVLIVDAVSETNIDYVFQIQKVVSGINWFTEGGVTTKYKSDTLLKNVSVLSPGLSYINDSYFLMVNWSDRLKELESSGYKVYIVCGDISNIIGRVLFNSFNNSGKTSVYVQGSANGCRTIITNAKGLNVNKETSFEYFEYNPNVSKLFDIMSKNYKCLVVGKL